MAIRQTAPPGDTDRGVARRGLSQLGLFAGFGVGLSVLYALTGLGVPCPLRALTGWDCPLCGGTRLGGALLHLDFAAAFAANPVVFVGLAVLTVLGLAWVVELLGGPVVRAPGWLRTLHARLGPGGWAAVLVPLALLWTVLRNVL